MKIAIIRTKAFFLMVADVILSHMLKQIAWSLVSALVRDETPVKTACLPKIVVFRFPTFADDFFSSAVERNVSKIAMVQTRYTKPFIRMASAVCQRKEDSALICYPCALFTS